MLRSLDIRIDSNVECVSIEYSNYFDRYLRYLLNNEKDGVVLFINDDIDAMWVHFVNDYGKRVGFRTKSEFQQLKKTTLSSKLGLGLNLNYMNFRTNKLLFGNIFESRKKALKTKYNIY